MATASNGNICTPTVPRRLFTEEFLAYLAARDEPFTSAEAELAGSCHVEPDSQGGWAVLRDGESINQGDVPIATFLREEVAQIAAAVVPGTARRLRYRLGEDPCERGFPVLFDGFVVGHVRHFRQELVEAMTVADALLASPLDFGWLLLALGAISAERAERAAAARLHQR